jgi:hypothetical protein
VNCDEVRLMQSVSKVAGCFVNLTAVALRDVTVSKRGKGTWSMEMKCVCINYTKEAFLGRKVYV